MYGKERTYAKINIGAFLHNIEYIRKKISKDTKLCAVIKTNGYGHGAVKLAKAAKDRVDYFAVATIWEGVELRNSGIDNDILVLGYTFKENYEEYLKYNIKATIFDYNAAKELSEMAINMETTANIHIKIDTGMNRIGYSCDKDYILDSINEIVKISKLQNIKIEGIFTHFASADKSDKRLSNIQEQKFMNVIEQLRKNNIEIENCHCSNSAGVIGDIGTKMNMVRVGIILYGLEPSEEMVNEYEELKPVMSIKSKIVYIKEVSAGQSVSYGETYTTSKTTKIATIPIGYGDGYPRNLSNKGYVLVKGQRADIVGRVCMDYCMVDVSSIEGVEVYDEVTLIGKDGNNKIKVEDMARLAGTFNYEFVCNIGSRVTRIYE